jgi:hypothetical protein
MYSESGSAAAHEPLADLARMLPGLETPYDAWRVDVEIAHAERLLQRATPLLAEAELATRHFQDSQTIADRCSAIDRNRQPIDASAAQDAASGGGFAWAVLMLATAAICCGGALSLWSFVPGKAHLWSLGLPVLIAGQAALLVGIVLQLARAWQTNRTATTDLQRVSRQLASLRDTANAQEEYRAPPFGPHFSAASPSSTLAFQQSRNNHRNPTR